jgi:iron complex outermembrane receptor protein
MAIASRTTAAGTNPPAGRRLLFPSALGRKLTLIAAVVLAVGSAACPAQSGPRSDRNQTQQLKGMSLEQLGGIDVTTYNKTPTELWETPAAMYVLTADDIARSGATSVADALRLVPGMEVGRLNSTTWAIGIRSLENNFSKSVLVLVDGRSVYTPLFAGVYWDVLDMPLRDIDHIEVIRGPGGTIWGPNAANGVINIITKSAADTQGVMADALAGNEDRTLDDLQIGGRTHQVSFRFFGRGFERRHEYHTDGVKDDSWHQERVGFRADRTQGVNSWFLDILGTTPVFDETSGGDLNFRWEREEASGNGLYLQAYLDRTLRTNTPLGETRNTFDIDFLQHLRAGERQQFTWGGGLRWSPYHILSRNPNETVLPVENTDHVYTAFLQDAVQLRSNLKATAGLKMEENNYSGFDLQPSLRLLWLPQPHQAVWLGLTRAVTTPSDIEAGFLLRGGSPTVYVQLLGNRSFMSEDVIGYEAGYRGLFAPRLYCDLSSFWNEYNHLQSFSAPSIATGGGVTAINIEYENQISGSTSGFEIAPRVTLASWWHLSAGYSFVSSNFSASGPTSDISSTGSVNTYEKSSPKHTVFAQSTMNLPYGIEFDPMFRYASALAAQKVPAYETMDVHVAKSLGRNLVLEAVGQNLFQPRHYEWGTGDPGQPNVGIERAAYVQLSFKQGRQSTP